MPSITARMLPLPSALLALSVSHAVASIVEARAEQSTHAPSPISFNPDENWDGIDGSWSSFTLRIGTPPQYVRTFASWTSYQTWAVIPAGCNTSANVQECSNTRGWIFDQTKSNTWDDIDIYALSIEENLGYSGNAIYGYDTVGLGGAGEGGPILKHTVVGGMAYPDFYLGVFGLNPKPTNFTSFNDPSTSYMTLLRQQKYIPSVSLGYTAGAIYRSTGELASLTLGGYDSSKFVENDVVFDFAPDNSRDVVVALQSITTPSQIESSPNPTQLLPSPIYAYMDATVAEIWLPAEACKAFESEFKLKYDKTSGLYLVDEALHQQLSDRNPSITFTLGTDLSDGKTVSIELPYGAFDLTAKPPYRYLTDQSYYFPLRRASNDTQYTIGRTFFQEAYITIDYESQNFNVSQRSWNDNAATQIVAIPPNTAAVSTSYPGVAFNSSSSDGISGGMIGVIVVGVAVVIAIASAGFFFFIRRRRRVTKEGQHEKLASDWGSTHNTIRGNSAAPSIPPDTVYPKVELAGSLPAIHTQFNERRLHSSGGISEVEGSTPRTPHEYSGSRSPGYGQSASTSPTDGYGTYSSTIAGGGTGIAFSGISPVTPNGGQVYEMAGDMPAIREMDGKALSEKEALAHREKKYNGVDPVTAVSPSDNSGWKRETPQRVNPENVVTGDTVIHSGWPSTERDLGEHRAFSFEEERTNGSHSHQNEDDFYF